MSIFLSISQGNSTYPADAAGGRATQALKFSVKMAYGWGVPVVATANETRAKEEE